MRSNWNLECWFLRREENRRTQRKTLRARKRTNNKLNPDMNARSGNPTRVTLVGGEPSHHCAIPAKLWESCQHSLTPERERLFCGGKFVSGKTPWWQTDRIALWYNAGGYQSKTHVPGWKKMLLEKDVVFIMSKVGDKANSKSLMGFKPMTSFKHWVAIPSTKL